MTPDLREEIALLRRTLQMVSARLDAIEAGLTANESAPVSPPAIEVRATVGPTSTPPTFATVKPEDRENLEQRIGSRWLNRIGIIAVLFGVAYFLKLAFENNWIGDSGRVAIGILSGIAVMLWSERFRKRGATAFSHSLKAVATGVLYLSLWAAFQLFHLLPASVAFGAMAVVTASTLSIALKQNAQIIGAMALFGGFASPGLVSTGENHEIFLFSYLALLSAAAAVLAIRRAWTYLLVTSAVAVLGYFLGWSFEFYKESELGLTLFFLLLFSAIFMLPALFVSEQQGGRARNMLAAILVLDAAATFVGLCVLLYDDHRAVLAWAVLALAAVYLVASHRAQTQVVRLLQVSIALGLITVVIPLKANAHFITLGWLAESAAMLYIGVRYSQRLFEIGGSVALTLAILRLIAIDNFHPAHAFWNMRALLFLLSIAITATIAHHSRKLASSDIHDESSMLRRSSEAFWYVSAIVAVVLVIVGLDHELSQAILPSPGTRNADWHGAEISLNFVRSAVWLAVGASLIIFGFVRRIAFYRWEALALLAITIAKVFVYDVEELNQGYRVGSFIVLGIILLAVSYAYQRNWLRLSGVKDQTHA